MQFKAELSTRRLIIQKAEALIRLKGYNAFSYKDISDELHIQRPGIHHHFPHKSDLGIAIIELELQRIRKRMVRFKDLSGNEQLKEIVTVFCVSGRKGHLCLMGAMASDLDTFQTPLRLKVQEMCGLVQQWVVSSLEKGRTEQNLHFQGKAVDRAMLVVSTLSSSLILRRISDQETAYRMLDQMLCDLGAGFTIGDLEPKITRPEFPF